MIKAIFSAPEEMSLCAKAYFIFGEQFNNIQYLTSIYNKNKKEEVNQKAPRHNEGLKRE